MAATQPTLAFLRDNAPWLGAGFAAACLSTFGQTSFVSVFAAELTQAHGLSQGGWAGIFAAGTTLSAAIMVWAGGLADRMDLGRLTALCLLGLGATCAAMALLPDGAPWAVLVALVLALRLLGQGMLSHVPMVALARWFAAGRGRALAIGAFGFAAGQAVLPLAFTIALPRVGAPVLWGAAALTCLAAAWPLRRAMARPRTPRGAEGQATATPGLDGTHWTRACVLRGATFWLLMPALIGPPAFGSAFYFFQAHLPDAKGWDRVGFVALFPLTMGVIVAASFAAGSLIDRIGATRLLAPALLPMAAGFALLSWAPSLAWAVPAAVGLAVTQGAMNTVPVAMWAERFGTDHIGAVKAAALAVIVLGTAIGPGLVGLLIDRGTTFPAQMPWIAAYVAASAGLAWVTLRRRDP
ncbi:MAG: MFS transporter [Paracoccaceae bacterium]